MNETRDIIWILFCFSGDRNDINSKYPTKKEVNIVIESIGILGTLTTNNIVRKSIKLPPIKAYHFDNISASTNTHDDKNIVPVNNNMIVIFNTNTLLSNTLFVIIIML